MAVPSNSHGDLSLAALRFTRRVAQRQALQRECHRLRRRCIAQIAGNRAVQLRLPAIETFYSVIRASNSRFCLRCAYPLCSLPLHLKINHKPLAPLHP
jgi:hypothetical protein